MTPHDLLASLETLAEAPNGIQRLRELVLELAVRGRLVEQEPGDEPASELLKRIKAQKARQVKDGKLKRVKVPEPISHAEIPFELPKGWVWVRLTEAFLKITDGTHHSPPNGPSGDFLYVTAKNIKSNGVLLAGATYVGASSPHHGCWPGSGAPGRASLPASAGVRWNRKESHLCRRLGRGWFRPAWD